MSFTQHWDPSSGFGSSNFNFCVVVDSSCPNFTSQTKFWEGSLRRRNFPSPPWPNVLPPWFYCFPNPNFFRFCFELNKSDIKHECGRVMVQRSVIKCSQPARRNNKTSKQHLLSQTGAGSAAAKRGMSRLASFKSFNVKEKGAEEKRFPFIKSGQKKKVKDRD